MTTVRSTKHMKARFHGKCAACKGTIAAGWPIVVLTDAAGKHAIHDRCFDPAILTPKGL